MEETNLSAQWFLNEIESRINGTNAICSPITQASIEKYDQERAEQQRAERESCRIEAEKEMERVRKRSEAQEHKHYTDIIDQQRAEHAEWVKFNNGYNAFTDKHVIRYD